MQENQKKNIFHGALLAFMLVGAFCSWLSVDRAIRVPEASAWLVPILWFSFFVTSFFLAGLLVREKYWVASTTVVSFMLSLFFAPNFWHLIILFISVLLASWGFRRIRRDMRLNIKISLWKSLLTGKTQIILAMALLISSQYFFTLSSMDGKKVMPKLNVNGDMLNVIIPVLGIVNPNFKNMDQEGLTVDQYLLKIQNENSKSENLEIMNDAAIDAQIPEGVPVEQREILKAELVKKIADTQSQLSQKNKELILAEMRKQFSAAVGQNLVGNEKMTEVLAGTVSEKMNEILQPKVVEEGSVSSMLPLIFSIVLFLTIASIGSVLSRIWFLLVILFFRIFLKCGLIEIKTEMVERERIRY